MAAGMVWWLTRFNSVGSIFLQVKTHPNEETTEAGKLIKKLKIKFLQ